MSLITPPSLSGKKRLSGHQFFRFFFSALRLRLRVFFRNAADVRRLVASFKGHEMQLVQNNFRYVMGVFIRSFVGTIGQTTFHKNGAALAKMVRAQFRQLSPGNDAVKICTFLHLAFAVVPLVVGGNGEAGYGLATFGGFEFWVRNDAAQNTNSIDAFHRNGVKM